MRHIPIWVLLGSVFFYHYCCGRHRPSHLLVSHLRALHFVDLGMTYFETFDDRGNDTRKNNGGRMVSPFGMRLPVT